MISVQPALKVEKVSCTSWAVCVFPSVTNRCIDDNYVTGTYVTQYSGISSQDQLHIWHFIIFASSPSDGELAKISPLCIVDRIIRNADQTQIMIN